MIKRSCLCAALMLALAGASPAMAQSDARHVVDVQAQDLGAALTSLAQQTRLQIVYPADLVQGKRAPALDGSLTAREALDRVLAGSGLTYAFIDAQTVTLSPVDGAGAGNAGDRDGANTGGAMGGGRGDVGAAQAAGAAGQDRPPSARGGDQAQNLEAIVVTGTRIRGGATPSPVISISGERIQEEGFADLGQVIRSLPQNFSGGQNPEVPGGNLLQAGIANQNVTGGSGLNLRGLGPDATLTLLNGRRMAYGGISQAVDISAIPVAAIARIEIVADGASAIYGSDAVGGVGNVILRREYEGVTVGVRRGDATGGGLSTEEYTATAGLLWSTGGMIAAYKDVSIDPIYADQRDYTTYLADPRTLHPGSRLRSGIMSAHQSIGDNVELRMDAMANERRQESSFFTSTAPQYTHVAPKTTSRWMSPGLEVSLPGDWTFTLGGAWGEVDHVHTQSSVVIATGLSTRNFDTCYCNEMYSYEGGFEGPLFGLPGGDARLAAGAGYRKNKYAQHNYLTGAATIRGDESARFAYAELDLPLVGPGSDTAGVDRLALTVAARAEDYASFGRVTTPKLGLIYAPSPEVTLKASWGKSFKAPTLENRYADRWANLYAPNILGGVGYGPRDLVLVSGGGNPGLEPERARTWSASVMFHPAALPGLEAELTWFDIDYTDRVVQPIASLVQALANPIYAGFINASPTLAEVEDIIARSTVLNGFDNPDYAIDNVVAIVHYRNINATRQKIEGLDLSASYRFEAAGGDLTVRGSASWIDSTQQTPGRPDAHPLAGTLFNPAELNGRLGLVWNRGGVSGSTFANYGSGVRNQVSGEKTASFTTFDATLRYATERAAGLLSGVEVALSAQNLLARDPPYVTPANRVFALPYDPTNASAIGRFVSLSLTKHF